MRRLAPLLLVIPLTACGGGSSGTSAAAPPAVPATIAPTVAPATAAPATPPATVPTPPPTAPPTPPPTAAPTPPPTAPPTPPPTPTPTPTPAVVGNSSTVTVLDDSATIYGAQDPGFYSTAGAPGSAPIDGLNCYHIMSTATHFHARISVFVAGRAVAVSPAIGIYHPTSGLPTDDNQNDPTSCDYEMHTHAAQGLIHMESAVYNATFTLGQLLDIWGQTLTATSFGPYSGTVRIFDTDETTGRAGAGTHQVVELLDPTKWRSTLLQSHHDYTIEIGAPWVPTPSDEFTTY